MNPAYQCYVDKVRELKGEPDRAMLGVGSCTQSSSLVGQVEQTAIDAANLLERTLGVAARLAGYFPPKPPSGDTAPTPSDSAARIRGAIIKIDYCGQEIDRALSAIDSALS